MEYRACNKVREIRNEKAVSDKVLLGRYASMTSTKKAICVKVKNEMPSGKIMLCRLNDVCAAAFSELIKKIGVFKIKQQQQVCGNTKT